MGFFKSIGRAFKKVARGIGRGAKWVSHGIAKGIDVGKQIAKGVGRIPVVGNFVKGIADKVGLDKVVGVVEDANKLIGKGGDIAAHLGEGNHKEALSKGRELMRDKNVRKGLSALKGRLG